MGRTTCLRQGRNPPDTPKHYKRERFLRILKVLFAVLSALSLSAAQSNGEDNGTMAKIMRLMVALRYNQPDVAKQLIQSGMDINVMDSGGTTPLMYALENNQPDNAKLMIERGADVNARNNEKWTPLMFAIRYNQPDNARLLVEKGAKVNVRNDQSWTPLFFACRYSDLATIRFLREHNADAKAKTETGRDVFLCLKENETLNDEEKRVVAENMQSKTSPSGGEKSGKLGHYRFYFLSAAGWIGAITQGVSTDISFRTTEYIPGLSTPLGTGTQTGKMSWGTALAFNVQWINFFINHRWAIDLSTQWAFLGTEALDVEGVSLSGQSILSTSSLIFKYNFNAKENEQFHSKQQNFTYPYIGVGPCFIHYSRLHAFASDDSGHTKDVRAAFDPVYGLTFKAGFDAIFGSGSFPTPDGMMGLDVRLNVPFSNEKITSLVEKEGDRVINVNPSNFQKIYPISFMICFNLGIGY